MADQFHLQNPVFQRCLHRLKCCRLNLSKLQVVLQLLLYPLAFLQFWLKQKTMQNLRQYSKRTRIFLRFIYHCA